MKYYKLLNELFEIYNNLCNNKDNKKINHIFHFVKKNKLNIDYNTNKFESLCNILEKYIKNSDLEKDFRYFTIKMSILEDYYYNIEKELKENNISYSYSVDDEDGVEEAFIFVINYLYEFLLFYEYYDVINIYKNRFNKYIDYV
jgi:hypothetical protein